MKQHSRMNLHITILSMSVVVEKCTRVRRQSQRQGHSLWLFVPLVQMAFVMRIP
jgi:hypothetical protein